MATCCAWAAAAAVGPPALPKEENGLPLSERAWRLAAGTVAPIAVLTALMDRARLAEALRSEPLSAASCCWLVALKPNEEFEKPVTVPVSLIEPPAVCGRAG